MANRGPTLDPNVFSISDLEALGSKKIPKMYREYYNEGAMDLISLRDNVAAFDRYKILPRALRNVKDIDTSTTLFGQKVTFPLAFSPSAMHKFAHPDGETATSRAASSMNVGMCLSSYATTSLEDVKAQGRGNPYMMQMCVVNDRNLTKQLLDRAEGAGYIALFLSVDVPVLGRRLNEFRNEFALPEGLDFPNILSGGLKEFAEGENSHDYDASLEWADIIPWLRRNTNMQIWLKGILNPADVLLAIEHGVDGVVISNHGGRQLDGVPATLDCLAECARVARGRIQIVVDGGIRRGSDIFKALALGAQHCFVGRIAIWGLAYKGQEGVELALKILLEEFRTTMALAGCRTVSEITPEHLTFLGTHGRLCKL
ncbi:FMN-dependent dehydrogenase [Exophiala viscosa]|uniref:Oxidase FUB9 n=1 Tax=Exophiala viscosa TaxID=2486360 RepID=A0AAN6E524_9EURO|nr:FMN-dependent dehydrogenase [Exophiala viscosa]